MTRSPKHLADAQLRQQLIRTRQAVRRRFQGEVADITRKTVNYQLKDKAKRASIQTYAFQAEQMYASSLEQTLKGLPEKTANALLKGINAVERATIGETQAQRNDNEEIAEVMAKWADHINNQILEEYLQQFSGRSYRTGDPARRSGKLEAFLREKTIASSVGHTVTVSLASAVGDNDVPHIFRLNYGTRSLKGGEKHGVRAPTFSVSLTPGAASKTAQLGDDRRPGFYYPGSGKGGRTFPYYLKVGDAGQVQLFGAKAGAGSTTRRPSAGIAPSYFVEYGVAEAAHQLQPEFKKLMNRWKQRVAQIRDTAGNLP